MPFWTIVIHVLLLSFLWHIQIKDSRNSYTGTLTRKKTKVFKDKKATNNANYPCSFKKHGHHHRWLLTTDHYPLAAKNIYYRKKYSSLPTVCWTICNKKIVMVGAFWWNLFDISSISLMEHFCVWVRAPSNDILCFLD